MTKIYKLKSKLFDSPRIIMVNFPVGLNKDSIQKEEIESLAIENFANLDNHFTDEHRYKIQQVLSDWF